MYKFKQPPAPSPATGHPANVTIKTVVCAGTLNSTITAPESYNFRGCFFCLLVVTMLQRFTYLCATHKTQNTKLSTMKVAIFTRVSTTRQATDRQAAELAELAERNGWQVVATITEIISGAKDSKHRPELQKLRELARSGKIDKVLVSEISRLGRRVSKVTTLLDELTALKVSVYIKQLGNETLNERGERNVFFMPALHVLLSFAEAERETLRERVISGMKHAASKGRHAGRPKGSRELSVLGKHPKAERLLKDGQSIRNAAKIAGISPTTVQKIANELKRTKCAQ